MTESAKERAERRRLEAVSSAFMRVPRLPLDVARDLLDAGYSRLDQVAGRSAETLLSEIRARNPGAPDSHLPALRLAIYVAETPRPDPRRLFPDQWA